jgi:D-amino-acid dehydrogenase
MLPNMLPKVGPGRLPTVFYNTGHGHLGWTLSAITADMLADAVQEKNALNQRATQPLT